MLLTGPVTGPALKEFRVAAGVELTQIAAITRISRRILEGIEAEQRDRLPALVYLRAFLHQYAREVGLDPRPTADGYLSRMGMR